PVTGLLALLPLLAKVLGYRGGVAARARCHDAVPVGMALGAQINDRPQVGVFEEGLRCSVVAMGGLELAAPSTRDGAAFRAAVTAACAAPVVVLVDGQSLDVNVEALGQEGVLEVCRLRAARPALQPGEPDATRVHPDPDIRDVREETAHPFEEV